MNVDCIHDAVSHNLRRLSQLYHRLTMYATPAVTYFLGGIVIHYHLTIFNSVS